MEETPHKNVSGILGLGSDIIEIKRIHKAIKQRQTRFYNKIFTESEITYCLKHKNSSTHFAGKFAAKEAVAKAIGTGFGSFLSFQDIEIKNEKNGKPHVIISKEVCQSIRSSSFLISISHCKKYAHAVAIWLGCNQCISQKIEKGN